MKTKTILVVMALATCFLAGCEAPCPLFGNHDAVYLGAIVKFREGQDMSNNVYVAFYDNYPRIVEYSYCRPITLHGGYYFLRQIQCTFDTNQIAFSSITYNDLESGTLPEDWVTQWQSYGIDTIHNPYEEVYEVDGDRCETNMGIPFYCDQCEDTYFIDTVILNRMLDEDPSFLTNTSTVIPYYIRNH